jgi:hypothetical protein
MSAWIAWGDGCMGTTNQISSARHAALSHRAMEVSGMIAGLSRGEVEKVMTADARPAKGASFTAVEALASARGLTNTVWSTIGSLSQDVPLADLRSLRVRSRYLKVARLSRDKAQTLPPHAKFKPLAANNRELISISTSVGSRSPHAPSRFPGPGRSRLHFLISLSHSNAS